MTSLRNIEPKLVVKLQPFGTERVMQHDFFARTKSSSYIPLSAKKKYTIVMKKVHEQVAKIS